MRQVYIVAALVIILAIGAGYYVWRLDNPPPPPPVPVTLPESPAPPVSATYYCDDGRTMQALFKKGPSTGLGANTLELSLSDGRAFNLPEQTAGSGMRYEAASTQYLTDVAFMGSGDNAYLTENGARTYDNCTAAFIHDSDAPGYATYTDRGQTFTFAFPSDFIVAGSPIGYTTDWSAEATTSGLVLARILVPDGYASDTNFIEASFTVGASSDPSALASCLTAPVAGATTTTERLGTERFAKLMWRGAAAGNRYDTTSYRIVRKGQCWAVEYTIRYGNIDNYPKGNVKEFDEALVVISLEEVAHSFQFLR